MKVNLVVLVQVLNNIIEIVVSVVYNAPAESPARQKVGLGDRAQALYGGLRLKHTIIGTSLGIEAKE